MRKKNVGAGDGAAALVRRAIRALRHGGMKNEHAMPFVARRFGLPARRIRALLYGEPVRLSVDEAVGIASGWERLMAERIVTLRAEIAAEEAAMRELDRRCLEVSELLRAAREAD